MRVEAEDKADVHRVVPPVQMLGLCKVSVAPHGDLAKPGLTAEVGSFVEIDIGLLVGGTVTAAIDQIERLGGVGQRDHQGLITPVAFVVDVNAVLALGIGRNQSAVGVNESLLEKLGGLLSPNTKAGVIDDVDQGQDVGRCKAPAEITLGSGVGDSLGTQGIEINLVVAPQFKVLHTLAAGDDVEGDVQNMVRFVIRQMSLEKVEVPIDTVDQANRSSQHENGADTAGTDPFDAIGVFVVDMGGSHHGFGLLGLAYILEPQANSPSSFLKDSLLASQTLFSESSTHSKTSLGLE